MRTVLILLAALAVLLASAPTARSNTYIVYSCKTRLGAKVPTDGLSTEGNVPGQYNACGTGGSFGMSLDSASALPPGSRSAWHFSAPPDTEIRQFDMWRSVTLNPSASDANNHEPVQYTSFPGSQYLTDRREWCGTSFCSGRGVDGSDLNPANLWYSGVLNGVHDVFFNVGCEGDAACAARPGGPMASMRIQAIQWVLTDNFLPTVTGATGPLVADKVHRGTEFVDFDAADRGSGLYWSIIEMRPPGGEWTTAKRTIVDANGGNCAETDGFPDNPYEFGFRVPCKLAATVELPWDTTSKPDGNYELRIRVEDAAGNSTTVAPARAFQIDNVPPPAATKPPSIVGTVKLGSPLVGERGEWTGTGNVYVDAWLRCTNKTDAASCTPIEGATARQYTVADIDLGRWLRYRVTATNPEGSTVAVSDVTLRATDANGYVPQCADGVDNDKDGKIDTDDPACPARANDNEAADTTTQMPTSTASPTPLPSATSTPSPTGTGSEPAGRGRPNGANASDAARLTVSGGTRRKLPFGRGAVTVVTLRDANGRPIADATVQVLQRMSVPGAHYVPARVPLVTDGDGHARYVIAPTFSRKLRFAYRSHALDKHFAATRQMRITVTSLTSLFTSRSYLHNDESVIFKGRLASRPVPARGVVIDLQAQVGTRWQTFQTLRTNAQGRWKASYHFRSTTGVQTYTFRARVRGDTGFPYKPSTSRQVKVRVSG